MLDKSSKPAMSWKLTSKTSCIFSFRIILSLLAREVVLWCPQVGLNRFPWSDHLNIMPLCFEFQASSWVWHWNGRTNSLWGFEIGFIEAYTRWVDFRSIWKYWVFSVFQVSHRPLYSLIVTCPGPIFIFFSPPLDPPSPPLLFSSSSLCATLWMKLSNFDVESSSDLATTA